MKLSPRITITRIDRTNETDRQSTDTVPAIIKQRLAEVMLEVIVSVLQIWGTTLEDVQEHNNKL